MDTFTTEEAKNKIDQLVKKAVTNRQNCRITSSEGETAVIMSEEAFHDITVTLELLSTFVAMEDSKVDLEDLQDVQVVG